MRVAVLWRGDHGRLDLRGLGVLGVSIPASLTVSEDCTVSGAWSDPAKLSEVEVIVGLVSHEVALTCSEGGDSSERRLSRLVAFCASFDSSRDEGYFC